MTTLFNAIKKGLTISGFDATMLVRNGAVFVDGIQCVDPVRHITKPVEIRINNHRLWVSPSAKGKHEQKTISQSD